MSRTFRDGTLEAQTLLHLRAFSPSVRHTTLPAIHRQVLVWLLEDLVLWFVETDRIKTFRPRRN
jgi:hypothetical protein